MLNDQFKRIGNLSEGVIIHAFIFISHILHVNFCSLIFFIFSIWLSKVKKSLWKIKKMCVNSITIYWNMQSLRFSWQSSPILALAVGLNGRASIQWDLWVSNVVVSKWTCITKGLLYFLGLWYLLLENIII